MLLPELDNEPLAGLLWWMIYNMTYCCHNTDDKVSVENYMYSYGLTSLLKS
jgi:hypothetical protein